MQYCSAAQTPDTTPVNDTVEMPTMGRHVQEEDRELLRNMLQDIKISSGTTSSVFGSADLVSELGEEVIEAIVGKCKYIFSVSFIMDNFPVFSKEVANKVIIVFNEIFNDIEEAEFLTNLDKNIISDMLFLDVKEQASDFDDEDGYYSDWNY